MAEKLARNQQKPNQITKNKMLNLISLSITVALIVGAFAIHPILGIIAVFSLVRVAV